MAALAKRRFLFWRRKAVDPAAPVSMARPMATHHDMESNTVVQCAQICLIDFTDAILVRICQFCLMLGFIAGTIAVLSTRYNINAAPWFNITWAIVQAIAIDGLFFAVWSIWQRAKGQGWLRVWYFLIGILLGCVAALVNDIVSFSELNRVSTISLTMYQLHISESDFSLSRSVLVVLVSILIVTLPRGKQLTETAPIEAPEELPEPLVKLDETEDLEADERPTYRSDSGGNYGDKIEALLQEQPDLNGKQIAEVVGCSERTAYKWRNRIIVPE